MTSPAALQQVETRFREDQLASALLLIVLGALALVAPAQNDTFWHLRSGREMWESGSILTSESFSHTAFGTPLANHWWLAQLAFYGAFSLGGPFLLTALAGFCAAAAVVASWRLTRGTTEVRIGLLALLGFITAPEWAVRPQVISLALLALMAHLVVRRRIRWLPVVCVVWANTHAMVIFGVVMACACAAEAAIWSRRYLRRDAVVALLCACVLMLSPLGWHYWPEVFVEIATSRQLRLQEYRPAFGHADDALFWVAAAVFAFVVARCRRNLRERSREDRILLIASAVFGVAAVTATRNIPFFAVIAVPAASRLWYSSDQPPRHRIRPAAAGAYVLIATTVVIALLGVIYQWRDAGVRVGWRPISPGILEAVARCRGPLYNQFVDGGYLMWALPERRVFVDSRVNAYPLQFLLRSRAADLDGDYEQLFRDYGITCALVPRDSALYGRLMNDRSMAPTFSDRTRTVFAKVDNTAGRSGWK